VKFLNNKLAMLHLLPYIKSDNIILLALVNTHSNKIIDSNKYRKSITEKCSEHLNVAGAK